MAAIQQLKLLAEFNQLMNQRLHQAVSGLSASQLAASRGAFFGSILGTLNHIMVGDIIWLKRFSVHPASQPALRSYLDIERPASLDLQLHDQFEMLDQQRSLMDEQIIDWASHLNDACLNEPLSYRSMAGVSSTQRFGDLILGLFMHQTHHRGQVTTLLSQLEVDFGDTDLIEIIPQM